MLREELISNFTGAGSNHTYRAALLEQAGYCAGYGTAPMASISTSKDSLTIDGYFFDTLFEVSKSTVQRVELDPITLKSNDWECLKVQKECWEERLEMHAAIQLHAPKSPYENPDTIWPELLVFNQYLPSTPPEKVNAYFQHGFVALMKALAVYDAQENNNLDLLYATMGLEVDMEDARIYEGWAVKMQSERRFCSTGKGYLGWVPLAAR